MSDTSKYVDRGFLVTQFTNFATRVSTVFAKKTELPTVNNGKLTIQKNGSTVGTFMANQSGDSEISIAVPTKVSDLTNDLNFIDNSVSNLQNYYDKTAVDTKISQIVTFGISVVDELPTDNISTHTIYLVPKVESLEKNVYDEYINTDGTTSGWERIGDTALTVDLSEYLKKTEAQSTYATISSLANYLLKTEVETENIDFSNYFN